MDARKNRSRIKISASGCSDSAAGRKMVLRKKKDRCLSIVRILKFAVGIYCFEVNLDGKIFIGSFEFN